MANPPVQTWVQTEVLRRLPLSTLIQFCSTTTTITPVCTEELKRRARKLAPDYPFAESDPIGSMVRLARFLLPRQPYNKPVEVGDELFYPLNDLMFRASLLRNKEVAEYLLRKGADIEPLLYGALFGGHLDWLRSIIGTDCPNCLLFRNLVTAHGQFLAKYPGVPILDEPTLQLLGSKGYPSIIRYWYDRTSDPQVGLDIIASRADNNTLQYLLGSPFWFNPWGIDYPSTRDIYFQTGLPFPTEEGGTGYVFKYYVEPVTSQDVEPLPGTGPRPRTDWATWNMDWKPYSWIDTYTNLTDNEEADVAAVVAGAPLTEQYRQPRLGLALLRAAIEAGNFPLIRRIQQELGISSPYLMANTVAVTPTLIWGYRDHGLLTPKVVDVLVSTAEDQATLEGLLQLAWIRDQLNWNRAYNAMARNPAIDAKSSFITHGGQYLDPDLVVHSMAWDGDFFRRMVVAEKLRDPRVLSQAIALDSSSKLELKNRGWTTTAEHLRSLSDPYLAQFLELVASNTNDVPGFVSWLTTTGLTPDLTEQLRAAACKRDPNCMVPSERPEVPPGLY